MVAPLVVLAFFAIALGFLGTPAWPGFQGFLTGNDAAFHPGALGEPGVLRLMLLSTAIVFLGLGLGWWFYGRKPVASADEPDAFERVQPDIFLLLRRKYFVDEVYEATLIRFNAWWARACDWLDQWVWNGAVQLLALLVVGLAWVNRFFDQYGVDGGFDEGCRRLTRGGGLLSRLQAGQVQSYLRLIGVGLTILVLFLIWGCRGS